MRFYRSVVLLVLLVLMTVGGSGLSYGAGKSENAANTRQGETETFVDIVPCAADEGFFAISTTFNEAAKFSADGEEGHFTQTGTFVAAPVMVTRWEEEEHDDHVHDVPAATEPREAEEITGRFTLEGTRRVNRNATTETFTFRVNATTEGGEPVRGHAVFHQTSVDGETRSFVEKESCR